MEADSAKKYKCLYNNFNYSASYKDVFDGQEKRNNSGNLHHVYTVSFPWNTPYKLTITIVGIVQIFWFEPSFLFFI